MFNDSIRFVAQSIEKSTVNEINSCYYQKYIDFFPSDLLKKLITIPSNVKFEKLEHQENRSRLRVSYSEMISKELNVIFRSSKITKMLEEKFNQKLTPGTADIWYDYTDYSLSPHRDDPRVKLAIQIYLDSNDNPGTVLYDSVEKSNVIETFPYILNSGYSLLNSEKSFHGTEGKVKQKTRKSVYIRYS
jgi:hypothetical protein